MSVDHYENFPVASVLCPPALRPAVVALYHYARTADDIADEGQATPEDRRVQLQHYRRTLLQRLHRQEGLKGMAMGSEGPADAATAAQAWPHVFGPLAAAVARFALPTQPLLDLLDAFEQDTYNPAYATRAELLDYCRRSANPVGRLLLHLYGMHDPRALAESDAICTALQLINFWQDFSRDHPRGRCYIPIEDAREFGVTSELVQGIGGDRAAGMDGGLNPAEWAALRDSPATQALVKSLVDWARALMLSGQGLPLRIQGRAGWELRLVVQGGLRILEKIEAMQYRSLHQRPRLHAGDVPLLLWRAARMRA
jgi:squalene synthase HpnC